MLELFGCIQGGKYNLGARLKRDMLRQPTATVETCSGSTYRVAVVFGKGSWWVRVDGSRGVSFATTADQVTIKNSRLIVNDVHGEQMLATSRLAGVSLSL